MAGHLSGGDFLERFTGAALRSNLDFSRHVDHGNVTSHACIGSRSLSLVADVERLVDALRFGEGTARRL